MKIKSILATKPEEYAAKLKDLKEEYFNLRFQHGVGQLENTSALLRVRRNIARLMTLMRAQG
ncbi:MAG: 50S ribosomal protein L29 [Proteobacteria bacterium]|nr:50S ribosomal protein L29 [Pseudomonadota bacterium]